MKTNKNTPRKGLTRQRIANKIHRNWIDIIWNLPKQLFAQNTGTKLLSLTLAILFWFFVMDHVDPEITRVFENVPIQLINTQELDQNNLKIMNQSDYFVDVEVVGRRNKVLNLNAKSIYLWADLRSVSNGVNKIFVNSSVNSDSISIKLLSPKEIVFTIDRVISVAKPVKIVISDDFRESLYQESMELEPFEINVVGPESLVNSVENLVGTISVNAISEDYSREVTLSPYNKDGALVNGVNLEQNTTQLSLKIGKVQEYDIVTEIQGSPKDGYEVVSATVTPAKIKVRGQIEKMVGIENIKASTIELLGDESETIIIEKDLLLPEGVEAESGSHTVQIELVIEPVEIKEFTYQWEEIELKHLNTAFKAEWMNSENGIQIKVKDVASKLVDLKKEDIIPYIDFSNVLSEGEYRLKVNLPNNLQFKEIIIEPISLDLQISEK